MLDTCLELSRSRILVAVSINWRFILRCTLPVKGAGPRNGVPTVPNGASCAKLRGIGHRSDQSQTVKRLLAVQEHLASLIPLFVFTFISLFIHFYSVFISLFVPCKFRIRHQSQRSYHCLASGKPQSEKKPSS